MVQWLGLQAFTANGLGSISSQGTKTVERSQYGQKKGHVFYSIFNISFNIVIYLVSLAALGLSCSPQDLSSWCIDSRCATWASVVVTCGLSSACGSGASLLCGIGNFSSPTRD